MNLKKMYSINGEMTKSKEREFSNSDSLREKKKAECRKQILRSARDSFEKNGYYETTMNEIARKTNISVASLFNYFPSKLDLMRELNRLKVFDFFEILDKLSGEAITCEQKMLCIFDNYLEDIYRFPKLSLQITEFCTFGILSNDINMEMEDIVSGLVQEGIMCGGFRRDADINAIKGIFFGLGFSAIARKLTREECKETFEKFLKLYEK